MHERIARIAERLQMVPDKLADPTNLRPDWIPEVPPKRPPVPAAVLIALVVRNEQISVLYTERSPHLRDHSGQVAFPGGKIDRSDADAAGAAMREAAEEVALDPADAEIMGYLPTYFTGTNYLITPVVAVVTPRAPFIANPREVAEVFEVPLAVLGDARSYGRYRIERRGKVHTTWKIDYDGHLIWGITANLTRRFFDRALASGDG